MHYEVEQKFPVADVAALERRLGALGATPAETVVQVDRYFAHPTRDFARTDEALRIRQVGVENFITYKGPKIAPTTKTRREIELPLGAGPPAAEQWQTLLEALGFRPAAVVRKQRRLLPLAWQGVTVEIALDNVEGVGTFVELELPADESNLEAAQQCIHDLAATLGLSSPEPRSYLELLLASPK